MAISTININFDSLSEAHDFDRSFRDPSYYAVFDRFAEFSVRYNFKYSIYIVAKDLEDPEVFARVRDWADAGHEIANHSWDHDMGLASRPLKNIQDDLCRSHEMIFRCTQKEPRGFVSPAWSQSDKLFQALSELNYLYDTSLFPSPLILLLVSRVFLNDPRNSRTKQILRRTSLFSEIFGATEERFRYTGIGAAKGIWEFPLPTGRLRRPIWHTLGYIFGWRYQKKVLHECLARRSWFYYLCHPADLLDPNEIPSQGRNRLTRTEIPLSEKIKRFEEIIVQIVDGSSELVTMLDLVSKTTQSHLQPSFASDFRTRNA